MRAPPPVWVATALAALLSIPATYAVQRGYDVLFHREPNPAKVVWSPHIAMFWRLGVASYAAGMTAMLTYQCARRDMVRVLRVLSMSVLVVGGASLLQGLLMP